MEIDRRAGALRAGEFFILRLRQRGEIQEKLEGIRCSGELRYKADENEFNCKRSKLRNSFRGPKASSYCLLLAYRSYSINRVYRPALIYVTSKLLGAIRAAVNNTE